MVQSILTDGFNLQSTHQLRAGSGLSAITDVAG